MRRKNQMPHIHLVTSANLVENVEVPEILDVLTNELCRQDSIKPEAVKAYHTLHSNWTMGKGAPHGFMHCEVRILSGRPLELRREISRAVHSKLAERFSGSVAAGEAAITVDLREMDADTYVK